MSIEKTKVIMVSILLYAVLGLVALVVGFFIFALIDSALFQNEVRRSYHPMVVPFLYLKLGPIIVTSYFIILSIYDLVKLKTLLWIAFFAISSISISYQFKNESLMYSLSFGALFSFLQFIAAFGSMRMAHRLFKQHSTTIIDRGD